MGHNDILIIAIVLITGTVLFILKGKMKEGLGPFNLRAIGLTLIASLVAILSLADIDTSKLSAAYGIFGAIAGYLFGLKDSN